jgi:uncharacterized protein involved in exopolysaccharide biosynthesis
MPPTNPSSPSFEYAEINSATIVELLFRHKKKIVVLPLLSIGLGALLIFFYPRTYASETKLQLQVGRESIGVDPTATTGQTINLMQSGREDEVKSAVELLTSRSIAALVVERLSADVVLGKTGPGSEVKPNVVAAALKKTVGTAIRWIKDIDPVSREEEAAIEIEKHLDATAERGSSVIVCRYEAESPELAQLVLAEIVQVFMAEHARVHRNQDSLDFFVEQRDELAAVLEERQHRLRDRKNELGLGTVEARRGSLESQVHAVDAARYEAEQELATSMARVEAIEEQLQDEPERMTSTRRLVPNSGADMMRDQLYALRVKEKDLRARYSDSHPMLLAIQEQIAEAQELIDAEDSQREVTTDDINLIYQQLSLDLRIEQNKIAGLEARLAALAEQREGILAELRRLNADGVTIEELEREVMVARNNWIQYSENLEQARIDQQREESRVSNVSLAQAATLHQKPVSPSKALVGLASLLLASFGTLAAVLFSERLNTRLRTREQVESALNVPLVGEIAKGGRQSRVLAPS